MNEPTILNFTFSNGVKSKHKYKKENGLIYASVKTFGGNEYFPTKWAAVLSPELYGENFGTFEEAPKKRGRK